MPFINWRYILFTHNDSDEEMTARARDGGGDRRRSAVLGDDRPPENMFSRRFVPGTPELAAIRHEIWDDNNLGNAIPGATPRAEIEVERRRSPGLPVVARPRPAAATLNARVTEPVDASVPGAGQLRPPAGAPRRAALRAGRHAHQPRLRARLAAAARSAGGATADVPITVTAPEQPGRYALKFDLVSEGIDWFEACGSPTTTKTLVVI